jgi:hypothetical protein
LTVRFVHIVDLCLTYICVKGRIVLHTYVTVLQCYIHITYILQCYIHITYILQCYIHIT